MARLRELYGPRGMETGPGLSLFQGSEIQLNAVAQRLEEEEDQEDKRRLNEEVTPPVFLTNFPLSRRRERDTSRGKLRRGCGGVR